jgi:hypothetical protein
MTHSAKFDRNTVTWQDREEFTDRPFTSAYITYGSIPRLRSHGIMLPLNLDHLKAAFEPRLVSTQDARIFVELSRGTSVCGSQLARVVPF